MPSDTAEYDRGPLHNALPTVDIPNVGTWYACVDCGRKGIGSVPGSCEGASDGG